MYYKQKGKIIPFFYVLVHLVLLLNEIAEKRKDHLILPCSSIVTEDNDEHEWIYTNYAKVIMA